MNSNFDTSLTCPYNTAHVMLRGRMQTHLTKCRIQYELMNQGNVQYEKCMFNNTHILPIPEIEIHELLCFDRRAADEIMSTEQRVLEAAPIHSLVIQASNCEEDWDNEVTERPVLEMVQEKAKTKPVLLVRHGVTPSERKKHRIEENLRHRELNDKK